MNFFCKTSLVIILFCSYQNVFANDSSEIISVSADIVALDESINLKFPNAESQEYFIVISLSNTQDTSIHFQIMTCSWGESFIFNQDSFNLFYPGCDINVPVRIEIEAHNSVKFFGKLRCYKKNIDVINPPSFKIGFVDLPYKFGDAPYLKKDKMKYKIYWSNDILLQSKLYQYEGVKTQQQVQIILRGNTKIEVY